MTMSKKIYLKDIPVDQLVGVKIVGAAGPIGTIKSYYVMEHSKIQRLVIYFNHSTFIQRVDLPLSEVENYKVVSNFWNKDLV